MILTGTQIVQEVRSKRVKIDPFNEDCCTTNSYDLSLGSKLLRYSDEVLDPHRSPVYEEIIIPSSGITLQRGDFVLGHSRERLGSDFFVPIIHGRSSTARLGVFVHVTADLIDIGSYGQTTFQIYCTMPVRLYPGMLFAQVSFWVPKGDIVLYDGKYQGSDGPIPSRISCDGDGAPTKEGEEQTT